MTYTYRVFIETEGGNTDAMHYASEKLYEGAIFRTNKPGTYFHGRPVIIYQVDSHPGNETPGIAHARVDGVQDDLGLRPLRATCLPFAPISRAS